MSYTNKTTEAAYQKEYYEAHKVALQEKKRARREKGKQQRVLITPKVGRPYWLSTNLNVKHGTIGGYIDYGCRCPACRGAMLQYEINRREQRVLTEDSYQAMMRKKYKRLREENKKQRVPVTENNGKVYWVSTHPNITHGKVNTYNYYACRCKACREARHIYYAIVKEKTNG